jgi:hypothetical protein
LRRWRRRASFHRPHQRRPLPPRRAGSAAPARGTRREVDVHDAYVAHLLGYVDVGALKPLRLVVNAGNGGAGLVIDRLAGQLPFEFVRLQHEPDGTFPHGVPNPLLPEHRSVTAEAVVAHGADFGIAWDGDYDRCFLFDERGQFIEGYYIVGLLAAAFLQKHPGAKIVHDPRLTWNTVDIVTRAGGVPVMSKTGHAFIKERMRLEDAVYGGEMSAHHYFRDFAYCDSGMIPWLLVAELVSRAGRPLSALVAECMAAFPASGEINRKVADAAAVLAAVEAAYGPVAVGVDRTDGLSMEFPAWRFNLRSSNTEPLLRLNVESRGDPELMKAGPGSCSRCSTLRHEATRGAGNPLRRRPIAEAIDGTDKNAAADSVPRCAGPVDRMRGHANGRCRQRQWNRQGIRRGRGTTGPPPAAEGDLGEPADPQDVVGGALPGPAAQRITRAITRATHVVRACAAGCLAAALVAGRAEQARALQRRPERHQLDAPRVLDDAQPLAGGEPQRLAAAFWQPDFESRGNDDGIHWATPRRHAG